MKRNLNDLKNPQKNLERPQMWGNRFFWPKSFKINKIINVGFCDNSIHRSLVLILNCIVYKLYGCTIALMKTKIF